MTNKLPNSMNAQTVGNLLVRFQSEPGDRLTDLLPGDKVRVKRGYLGRLNSHIAERAWKLNGAVLEVLWIRGDRVNVSGPNSLIGNWLSQSIPLDSVERVPEADTNSAPFSGDKFRIKSDYPYWLPPIAEQKWKNERTVLTLEHLTYDGIFAVVKGSQGVSLDPIMQAVPSDSLERIPKETVESLAQGTVFMDGDGFLCMKTDETERTNTVHTRNINLQHLYLTYTDCAGTLHDQPAIDLVQHGTLVDPVTGDDMEIDGAYLDPNDGPLTVWESQLADIYYDWFANYLSIERMAEDYNLDVNTMNGLLSRGRFLHEIRCQSKPELYDDKH